MTEPTDRPTSPGGDPALQSGRGRSRRRLLQGGLGATPFLLTLVSPPVLGNDRCVPISSFVSMPQSVRDTPFVCRGQTPGFWKQEQKFSQWPAPFVPVTVGSKKATLFKDWFTPLPPSTGQFDWKTATFLDVLKTEDLAASKGPPFDVARHSVAMLLNINSGFIPAAILTIALVQEIWTSYIQTGGGTIGFFQATPTVKLFHDGIVEFYLSLVEDP